MSAKTVNSRSYGVRQSLQGVAPTAVRWSGIRAEHYIRTVAHQRLADHTPQEVTDDLEKLGRSGRMADWQYRQTVEAIQQVLRIAEVAWAQQCDWAYGRRPHKPCRSIILPLHGRWRQQRARATENQRRRMASTRLRVATHRRYGVRRGLRRCGTETPQAANC